VGPYTVKAFEACHAPQLESLFFAIQESGKCILYATDTGPFSQRSWEALSGMLFDAAIIESTLGTSRASDSHDHHMTREQCIDHHSELKRRGLMKPNGINVAHHFSHNGNPPHVDLSAMLADQGILTAYDGMIVSTQD
jgi:phosphoribosyl 1,2-cyclic phosphate phosphodiesterase